MAGVRTLKVAFVHPGLGLGGAERWVADAATALRLRGHRIVIWTAELDRTNCFEPFRDGSLDVRRRAAMLPRSILGRLRAPCNILRMAAAGWALGAEPDPPDVVVADLVSHSLPLLRRRAGCPVLFYCHYPDRLLAPRRDGLFSLYRRVIDRLEESGLASADRVLVNSRFTASRFAEAFSLLPAPSVVYPGVAVEDFAATPDIADDGPISVLVLGRFDPGKNLELAIDTLVELRRRLPAERFRRVELCFAGGLDRRRPESVALLKRLRGLAAERGLAAQVRFVENPSDLQRLSLLAACRCLLYTPRNEHFGLVPVEAMAAGRPVVAVHEGGPRETIGDGLQGKLRAARPADFAEALEEWIMDAGAARVFGDRGRIRAQDFSQHRLGAALEEHLCAVAG